jgi:alpha 1,3-glucosidase
MDFVKGDQDIPQVDTHWIAESGVLDVFLMMGPTAKDVFQQYSTLTGPTPLPPVGIAIFPNAFLLTSDYSQLFSLAYHQCRWNYNDEKDVAQSVQPLLPGFVIAILSLQS